METIVVLTRVRCYSIFKTLKMANGSFLRSGSFAFYKSFYNLKMSPSINDKNLSGHWHCDRLSLIATGQAWVWSNILSWPPMFAAISCFLQMCKVGQILVCCVQWTGGSGRAVGAGGSVHLAPAKYRPGDLGLPRPTLEGLCRCSDWWDRGGEDESIATVGDDLVRCFPLNFDALPTLPLRSMLFFPAIIILFVIWYFSLTSHLSRTSPFLS